LNDVRVDAHQEDDDRMRELPTGTVTFLLTDIEGSTRLLSELGTERYAEALDNHRRLLRAAFERHQGYEVDYEGDGFVLAFQSARGALAAADEGQRSLAGHRWPEGRTLRVRMGIHSGEVLLARPKYVGLAIHEAARIMAAAHGGQVLVSAETAALAGADTLRDLGKHQLKDFPEPVAIFQLGDADFPPLRTISNTNLPHPASSFVGRERELREITRLLHEGARLLTLTGPGGTGKTRLALEAAASLVEDYRGGVFWVALASLRDPLLVTEAISQTVGAKDGLAEHIGESELLLVLDNLEQVIDAAPQLSALLERCASLTLLVTSRELLQVRGEVEYRVPPLAASDAVSLFCERAGTEESEEIAELCERLEALPLAVELAAARVRLLSPAQIIERLSQRLDLLKGGRDADPRQQTLRATIEWSYDLLSPEQQNLFARFSVFAGGCTLEAAEDVCAADLDSLQSLVEKSLLRHSDDRLSMLETIRQFAHEQLDDDSGAVSNRHAEWYLAFAERANEQLYGPEQSLWLRLLELEHDNLRAALAWLYQERQLEPALRLSAALHPFWYKHAHIDEGRRWLERAVSASDGQPAALRARVLRGASLFAGAQNDSKRAQDLAEQSLALYRDLADQRGIALLLGDLGAAAVRRGDYAAARRSYAESIAIFRELDEPRMLATVVANLGDLAFRQGEVDQASDLIRESLELQRRLGATFGVAISLLTLGFVWLRQGREEEASSALEEGMLLALDLGSTDNVAYGLEGFAAVAAARGEWHRAARLLGRADAIREATATDLEAAEQVVHEETLGALRAACSEAEIAGWLAAGRQLSDDEAVSLALELRSAAQA
jgi:predicted ATPase/class 3 adenylate cyclase